MNKQVNKRSIAEFGAEPTAATIEHPKKKFLAKACLGALALATAATASSAKPNKADAHPYASGSARLSHSLDYVGPTSNLIWVEDLAKARQAAQDIAATNATTVRIFQAYNPGRTEISSDHSRLCNAAEAARENNLTFEISFIGYQEVNNQEGDKQLRHNFVPSSAGSVSRYLNVVKSILLDIAGPDANKPGPNGAPPCVEQPLPEIIVEDFDEVNSGGFNSNQDAAKKYAYLESQAIPALAKVESDINKAFEIRNPSSQEDAPHFTLVHAVGALAVGNHDPIGFLKDFDQELKNFGIRHPNFLLAVHPYPVDPTANPAQVEASIYPILRAELDSAWPNDNISVFYDEFAVNAISEAKRGLYGPKSLQAAAVSEGRQAQYYRATIAEAASEDGVVGALTFQSQDVRNDGWPSSVLDPNRGHKDSWNSLSQANNQARLGTLQK